LKKTIASLLIGSIIIASCTKNEFTPVIAEECLLQTANPGGHSYASDSVVLISYTKKQCGLMPLSSRNFWVYEDSIFNDGVFASVKLDTLRFTTTYKSLTDNLVWWQSSVSVGLPEKMYSNDSSLFDLQNRMFTPGIMDAHKSYSLFQGDSLKYLTSFEDAAAIGRSVKMDDILTTRAGLFADCILFEKNARNYRLDQMYFKPQFGVVKYILYKAPMGTRTIKLQQVSTLVAFHIE
jgi:hypothetical protein